MKNCSPNCMHTCRSLNIWNSVEAQICLVTQNNCIIVTYGNGCYGNSMCGRYDSQKDLCYMKLKRGGKKENLTQSTLVLASKTCNLCTHLMTTLVNYHKKNIPNQINLTFKQFYR